MYSQNFQVMPVAPIPLMPLALGPSTPRKGKWYILDTDAPPVIEVAAAPVCADAWPSWGPPRDPVVQDDLPAKWLNP